MDSVQESKYMVECINVKMEHEEMMNMKEEEPRVKQEPEIDTFFVALQPEMDMESDEEEWKPPVEQSEEVKENSNDSEDSDEDSEKEKRRRKLCRRSVGRRTRGKWEIKPGEFEGIKRPKLPPLTCYICPKVNRTAYTQLCHLTEHYENRGAISAGQYPCKVLPCGKVFTTRKFLDCHKRFHEVEKLFDCKICGRSFSSNKISQIHRKSHDREKTFNCEICPASFVHANSLTIHVEEHIKDRPFPKELLDIYVMPTFDCSNVKAKPDVAQELLTGGILFKCSQCSKRFGSFNDRRNHQNRDHPKMMTCNLCGKVLRGQFAHRLHMVIHTKEKPFKCKYCDEGFRNPNLLMNHRRATHGRGDIMKQHRPHQCETCGKSYVKKFSLKEHINCHHKGLKLVCDLCGKSYGTRSRLIQHFKKLHLSEQQEPKPRTPRKPTKFRMGPKKEPKCPECGFVAGMKKELRIHRTKEHYNNLFCTDCNVTMDNILMYRSHMQDHKDGISVVAGPGRHGQIFGCLRCDKFYTDRRFLREHINMSHNSITFTCDHCDMIFQTKRAMVRHLSKTHGVIEKEPKAKKVEGLKVKKPKKTKIKFPPPSETSSQSSLQYQMEPPQSSPLALQMPHQSPHAMQTTSQTLAQTNELQQHFKVEPQMQYLHYGNM